MRRAISCEDIRGAIELNLERGECTSPTEVCETLANYGFPHAMRGSAMSSRPDRDVFDQVCNYAAGNSCFEYSIRGNTRVIRRRREGGAR